MEDRSVYVQELKDRVATSRYRVDADAVAAAIIRRCRLERDGLDEGAGFLRLFSGEVVEPD